MSGLVKISRRGILRALVAGVGMRILPGLADGTPPSDRGIGGTGITALPGSGAIGFLGSIQRFGSIYVNGDRISYPADAEVRIDGRRRSVRDLMIGQVVKTVATPKSGRLVTDRIVIDSEVVGAIAALDGARMVVLGQTVNMGTTGTSAFTIGERVAVSGIRRLDGTIEARLVEPAGARMDQVVGPAIYRGWLLSIGGLSLFGPDARFDGQRVIVRGRATPRGLMVKTIAIDGLPEGPGVTRLSVEAYVALRGSQLQLGSGIVVNETSASPAPPDDGSPSVVDIDVSRQAAQRAATIRAMREGQGNVPAGLRGVRPGQGTAPQGAPPSGPAGFAGGDGPSGLDSRIQQWRSQNGGGGPGGG